MPQPSRISVAMCTYNGEKFVHEQLRSIAAQTRPPNELIALDDCSTDRTADILRDFAASAPFPVTVHVNPSNIGRLSRGITRNFEAATLMCTGDLIVPSDQDDIWMPDKLERMAGMMDADPSLAGLFSDAQLVTVTGEPEGTLLSQTTGLNAAEQARLEAGDALPLLLSMTKVYGSSMLFHARLKQYLPVPKHWWFDAWMAAVAAIHGRLVFVPEELYKYRIHPNQSVSARVQTASSRVQRWRSSAREYWEASGPPLGDLYDHIAATDSPRKEEYLAYLKGRMDLLRFRADLPESRLARTLKVAGRSRDYHRFFNGWRSLAKDLTA